MTLMSTQSTSVEAFKETKTSGKISKQQHVILAWFERHGVPATSGELLGSRVKNLNLWRARITELANLGAIREVDRRKCGWSGRQAIVWAPQPRPWQPRRTRADYYRELEGLVDQALLALERSEDPATREEGATLRLARYRLLDLTPQ